MSKLSKLMYILRKRVAPIIGAIGTLLIGLAIIIEWISSGIWRFPSQSGFVVWGIMLMCIGTLIYIFGKFKKKG